MGKDRRERVWSPEFRDELSEMVRVGAQQMIRAAGFGQLADLVAKVKFVDGIDEREIRRKAA